MSSITKIFSPTIGRKVLMALTGLFLCVFLCEHLYGNLLLYYNDHGHQFELYTHILTRTLLIRIVEYVLFGSFIIHMIDALMLTINNKKARPIGYAMQKSSENSSWYSRNMGLTGSIILFFLIVHLRTFFFPHRFLGDTGSMFAEVVEAFKNPLYSGFYILSVIILGLHLNHGAQSAFHTLGLSNKSYAPIIKLCGTVFALIITLGFASVPVAFYFEFLK
ncbi:MAG: succinate dehydrogenase cytochrome b subunit [Bacteroidota bacterium]